MSTTFPESFLSSAGATALADDEFRAPMGLTERERCPQCHGPMSRSDASGLCWRCMP